MGPRCRRTAGILLTVAVVGVPAPGRADTTPVAPVPATTPGELRTHATPYSIGIEWDLAGDTNHNATCLVRYRPEGAAEWKTALPLFRVDFHGWYGATKADRAYNMVAGSILFLRPGTRYEVRPDLSDPDGGSASKTFVIATRPVPARPEGGKAYHVAPGDGGGDGSNAAPFRGVAAAQAVAQPGDVFHLAAGSYGDVTLDTPGKPGRPVGWVAAGDAVFGSATITAGHLWLEGIAFRKDQRATALKAVGAVPDVAVSRCTFRGFRSAIVLNPQARDWSITDNDVVGDNDAAASNLEGEGIDLAKSDGHVVAHNRVSRVQAGVHYARRNCDVFGNDILDTTDDGIETDYGYANIRLWGNRITNYKNNGISFQPMYCGPWYVLFNQVVGPGHSFKFRVQDRFVLAHNTVVTWGVVSPRMHHVLTSLSRNNLYIRAGSSDVPLWAVVRYKEDRPELVRELPSEPNWMTDVDYDGFDWGRARTPFHWGKGYADLAAFSAGVGVEKHGARVRKEEVFEAWPIPEEPGRVDPPRLALRAGSAAVDAGAALPNVNDGFTGTAPDLGCHEHGKPLPHYGPRPRK